MMIKMKIPNVSPTERALAKNVDLSRLRKKDPRKADFIEEVAERVRRTPDCGRCGGTGHRAGCASEPDSMQDAVGAQFGSDDPRHAVEACSGCCPACHPEVTSDELIAEIDSPHRLPWQDNGDGSYTTLTGHRLYPVREIDGETLKHPTVPLMFFTNVHGYEYACIHEECDYTAVVSVTEESTRILFTTGSDLCCGEASRMMAPTSSAPGRL